MAKVAGAAHAFVHNMKASRCESSENPSPNSKKIAVMSDQHDGEEEQIEIATPSTASHIKPIPAESAFPTPPRRAQSGPCDSQQSGRQSPAPGRMFNFGNSSLAPKQHKSVDALRSSVARGTSAGLVRTSELENSWQKREVTKKNSQFFEQAFAIREPYHSARERVTRDSTVLLEIQFNCCLEQEPRFLNDLLTTVAEIYHKPHNNIMITATTDAHIMIAGSTEPAYLLAITALSSEIASIKNMRTTIMVQDFLSDSLKIPATRGVIKFLSVKAEDLGTNGTTVQGEIEKLEAEEKRLSSLRSRQSMRRGRISALPSLDEKFGGVEHSRSDTPILPPDYVEDEDEAKPYRVQPSAGVITRGKKSIMSLWKKG